ncbi:MAG: alpha/beta fold hydrolase [Tepidisphaera sp.]|nr:alpha/beta fold hydrolase [Tepidisphaera sp.]
MKSAARAKPEGGTTESKPRGFRAWLRRRRWRVTGAVITLLGAVLALSSCNMPGPKATPEQIAALARDTLPAQPATAAEKEVPALSYLHSGDPSKPRVIYIHGTPGDATGWADFLVDPVMGCESIAVDRLGFGKSGPKGGGGVDSFEMQAKAIAPLLVKQGGKWPIVVGHSLGGPIAAWIAGAYPDKVSGLVIVAGSLDPDLEKPGLGQEIATTDLARFLMPRALDNSMGELNAAKAQTKLLAPLLEKITCPVVVIHGTTDELVPYANVAYIQKMVTHAASLQVFTIQKQGHFVPWERPELIREAVEDLVKPTGAGAAGAATPSPAPTPSAPSGQGTPK